MPQLVTIAAGNGANSGRTVPLVDTEVRTVDLAGQPIELHIGVVDVDDIPRRYAMADLTPVEVTCGRCGRRIVPNRNGGWFLPGVDWHLANTCDGTHLHRPVIAEVR